MSAGRRLSVCYAAPGQRLLSTAGSTRNVLSVAQAMSEWADVTVAFRSIAERPAAAAYRVIAIDEASDADEAARDDVAVRGINPFAHLAYLRRLRRFAQRAAAQYDIVFEKGWRFSGYLTREFARLNIPCALIENDARYWNEPIRHFKTLLRYLAQLGTQALAASCSQRAPLVIAETEELKEVLVELRGIAPARIEVVELGVDHGVFKAADQIAARTALGIDPHATVLLYVGGLDIYHDLGPVIEALGGFGSQKNVELHVVGDGELRQAYEQRARQLSVRGAFHGQLSHRKVPQFIAAADLCLAPYQPSRFYAGKIAFSTLKIPEYMACARPVASVPQGHILSLIEPGVNGFLLPNEVQAWEEFLPKLPSRERLAQMGAQAERRAAHLSWSRTAAEYLERVRMREGFHDQARVPA